MCACQTVRVCKTFFTWSLGVSNNAIYQPSSGCKRFVSAPRLKQTKPRLANKASQVSTWLLEAARYYQISPDNDLILLPYADKAAVHALFKEEMLRAGVDEKDVAKLSYFRSIWNVEPSLQHIRIRRWLRFAVCDECIGFRQRREETRDYKVRDEIIKEEFAHHRFVSGERHSYYKRALAKDAISIIIDGSDNSQYWSPYFKDRTSSGQSSWKVALHVMGAIVHGSTAYAYTILDTCPLGANVTIDILHRVLVAEKAKRGGSLPRVLYLQLDNTTRQCKNKFVMAWLALLVTCGVFDEVYLSFLPKGHTHEDIDQMFSCIARYLRKHDCPSPSAFVDCIREAYTYNLTDPVVEHLTHVANISDWIAPHIAPLTHITGWHQFHFKVHGAGERREARLRVREWIATRDQRATWSGLERQKTDSLVFLNTPLTKHFLSCPPFETRPPPIKRKAKRLRTNVGDKQVRDSAARLRTDVERMIRARRIADDHAADLRAAVAKLNALDIDDPLDFDWDTSIYADAYTEMRRREREEKGEGEEQEDRDTELERSVLQHPVGSVWAVRSDFDSEPGWEKKPKQKERAWLVRVRGSVCRAVGGELRVPVEYYEAAAKKKKCRDKSVRRKYKLGGERVRLAPNELQVELKLNARDSRKYATISRHSLNTLQHWVARWVEAAKRDLRAGEERPVS